MKLCAAAACAVSLAALVGQGSAFIASPRPLATSLTSCTTSSQALVPCRRSHAASPLTMSVSPVDALASANLLLAAAETTELGNIGVNSTLFKPIFLGGVLIMFSGVVVAYIVSTIIDKADLYEELSEELEGKYEVAEFGTEAQKEKDALQRAKESAIIKEDEEVPAVSSAVDEYSD